MFYLLYDDTDCLYGLSELQISWGIEDNSKIIFLISQQKHLLSWQDGSNEGSLNIY